MKYLDNLESFQKEQRMLEEYNGFELNERKINFSVFDKIYDYFNEKIGKRVWLYTALFLQKLGLLKKYGVTIYPYSIKGGVPSPKGISFPKKLVNEEQIKLEHPNDEIVNLNADQLKDELLFQFQSKEPIFIWGAPGIGKTEIVSQVAKKMNCDLIVFTLSVRDPVDFLGLPSIRDGKTVYNSPGIFPPSKNTPEGKTEEAGRGGILFFDEMNQGHPAVLNAAMRLILERRLDEYILPDNWVVFAAGNRKEEAPTVSDLSHALANRMTHVNYVPDVESWTKWARSEEGKKNGEFLVDKDIISFINFNKKYFHYLDPDLESPAWASPRSWTKASEEYIARMAAAKKQGKTLSKDDIIHIVGKRVGKSTAIEFYNFLELINSIDIKSLGKVYTDPMNAPLPPKTGKDYVPDKTYAILSAIAFAKDGKNLTVAEFSNLVDYAIRLKQEEYATSLIKLVSSLNKHLKTEPGISPILKKWADNYSDFLNIGQDD